MNNQAQPSNNNSKVKYPISQLSFDIVLVLLAAWSEVGYAAFSSGAVSESILDPLKRYLYPDISHAHAQQTTDTLNIISKVLGIADASLTIATILDMRQKREKFQNEFSKGIQQLKSGSINVGIFIINLLIFLFSFVVMAFSPWTGLLMQHFNKEFSLAAGITMLTGQMTILFMQNANYIFSTPGSIKKFLALPADQKQTIFSNIFCTRQGAGLILRSIANAGSRAIRFYGIGAFTNKYIFNNSAIGVPYSSFAAFSIAYRMIATQAVNDYKDTFQLSSQKNVSEGNEESLKANHQPGQIFCLRTSLGFLALLIGMVFCLRTFSTPALYTGPIDHPEKNYGTKDLVLSSLGLVFGAFSSYQYCRFMWNLGHEAFTNLSNSMFSVRENKDDYQPLTNKPDSDSDPEMAATNQM